jgi:hypothetical protein
MQNGRLGADGYINVAPSVGLSGERGMSKFFPPLFVKFTTQNRRLTFSFWNRLFHIRSILGQTSIGSSLLLLVFLTRGCHPATRQLDLP